MTKSQYIDVGARYQIESTVGQGGMGEVYRAYDRILDKTVAIKRLNDSLLHNQSGDRVTEIREALTREFKVMASLKHPHIMPVLDYGFDRNDQPFFTMDFLDQAKSLVMVAQSGDLRFKGQLLIQLLQALAYLHRHQIIHRDIKPENVLVTPSQQVKVLDFGLATDPGGDNKVVGTLLYIAPEVLRGRSISLASDLYAVGVMAYEIFTGSHPFTVTNTQKLIMDIINTTPDITPIPDDDALSISNFAPDEDALLLSTVIMRLLEKEAINRYTNAEDVIKDLCLALGMEIPAETVVLRESYLRSAKLVGRDEEIAKLRTALEQLHQDVGSFWLLGGESGVGKSRLSDELRIVALTEGITVLHGQAVSEGGLLFQLWREPLRHILLTTDVTPKELAALHEIIPDISHLTQQEIAAPLEYSDTDRLNFLVNTITEIFLRQTQPILLILEDLQWAGESLKILHALEGVTRSKPLMILANYRHDETPELATSFTHAEFIELQRLGEVAIKSLTESIIGNVDNREHVVDYIKDETEGNAFFIVEVLRALAEDAGRLSEIGAYTLPPSIIAGGMRQIILRRLQKVPQEMYDLVQLAAIIGRQLDMRLLQYLHDQSKPDFEFETWLDICVNVAIFSGGADHWQFAHDKIREIVLEALEEQERQSLHHRVAHAIETVYQEDINEYANILVWHWRHAGRPDREIQHLTNAIKMVHSTQDFREQRALCQHALDLDAERYLDDPVKFTATAYYYLAEAENKLGNLDKCVENAQQAVMYYQQIDDQFGVAESLNEIGDAYLWLNQHEKAIEYITQAQQLYAQIGMLNKVGLTNNNLAIVASNQGDNDRAQKLFELSLEQNTKAGDIMGQGRSLTNLGVIAGHLQRFAESEQYLRRSLEIMRSINNRTGASIALFNIASNYHDEGNFTKAHEVLDEAYAEVRPTGYLIVLAHIYSLYAQIDRKSGNKESAIDYCYQEYKTRMSLGNYLQAITVLLILADWQLEWGDSKAAYDLYTEALQKAIELQEKAGILLAILHRLQWIVTEESDHAKALTQYFVVERELDENKISSFNYEKKLKKRLSEELSENVSAAVYGESKRQAEDINYQQLVDEWLKN